MPISPGIRAIALLEAAKGAVVIVAGFGLLLLVHRDAQAYAEQLVRHLHLNPAQHYPQVFLHLMQGVSDARLHLLSLGAAAYALVRFVEAYGLWRMRRWAEWLGASSGAIYIPFEVYEIGKRATTLDVGALLVNVIVVAYLLRVLAGRKTPSAGEAA